MENRNRGDVFWKVLAIVLLVVLVGMVAFIYQAQTKPKYIYYETDDHKPKSELAALAPSLQLDHGSIYWVADLAESAMPFVVNIQTSIDMSERQREAENQPDSPQDFFREWRDLAPEDMQEFDFRQMPQDHPPVGGEGSGFVIREDGYIVTNAHVVNGADKFTVRMDDGEEYDAELIGVDNFKDIAVIKINASNLPVAVLGNSDETRIGEPVVAIGSPLGFEATVTAGILSTNRRSIEDLGRNNDVRSPQTYLQTDAAINQGNSGGPLLNADGEVVGINQAIARRDYNFVPIEGIGFAIPINDVKSAIEQLVTTGKVVYPGIQATIAAVDEYLQRNPDLELEVKEGVFVVSVTVGGPADKAGIDAGDVILSINEDQVTSGKQLIEIIGTHKVGERVTLLVARQGGNKQEEISVVLGELDTSGVSFSN
jgi:serine protease Do